MKKVLFCIMVLFVACQSSQNAQQDKQACAYAQKEENLETWEEYLESFPKGECSFEARSKIRKLKKEREEEEKKAAYQRERKIGHLIWSDRSSNEVDWSTAKEYCENLTEGGFADWRLPNIDELRTIIKNCFKTETSGECKLSEKSGCLSSNCWQPKGICYCDGRSNNGGYYSKLGDDDNVWLWSSTQLDYSDFALTVNFKNGSVGPSLRNFGRNVRCVRNY